MMILSTLDNASATLVGIGLSMSLATFAGIWRVGSKLGEICAEIRDHGGRIERIERREDVHDTYHRSHGLT